MSTLSSCSSAVKLTLALLSCSNVVVSIQGNINLPSNVTLVQSIVSNSKNYPGYCELSCSGVAEIGS